jgi:hypothetical protein
MFSHTTSAITEFWFFSRTCSYFLKNNEPVGEHFIDITEVSDIENAIIIKALTRPKL